MRVAMSVQEKSAKSAVNERFGRSPFFAIVDTATNETEFVVNDAADGGGAGVKTARILLKQKVDAVIVGNIGPKAFEVLTKAGVPIYGGLSGNIQDSLELFQNGKLGQLTGSNN